MLEGLLAPMRVVLQRSASDWLIVLATWLVIVCATTLVAIGVLYGDAVALTGLRQAIADRPATATAVTVQLRTSAADLGEVEPILDQQLGRVLAWTGGELVTVLRSESYALPDQPSTDRTDLAIFGAYEGIERHAELTDGAWHRPGVEPMEVSLSRSAAEALGLSVGDELELTSQRGRDRVLRVSVAGTWEPLDPASPYWRGDALELDGVTETSSFRTHGPFIVGRTDLLERAATVNLALEARALPDFANLAVDDVDAMRADTAALERRLTDALGSRTFFGIQTELDGILADTNRSLLVSRSGVVVLTIQFAVLAGYALLLVAALLVEQRRIETALLRSRGAGVAHVALLSLLEALVLVVPAALAAPWLALGVLELLNVAGPLADAGVRIDPAVDPTVLVAVGTAGLAAVVGLVLPVLGAGRGLAATRQTISRQGSRTLAQRLGLDLVLVVLAGIGLWQLRQYGAPLTETVRGTVGLDPLLVAAPAVGLLAGSILALRIVPLAAEIGERLLAGRRGLVGPLGARQLSRRPLRYTRSALLLMLAAALGTFAGAYASTWTRSQADQAAYRTPTDVRVAVSSFAELPGWAIGAAYRSVPGVEAALPVALDRFDAGPATGRLLAIDAARAASAIAFRADLADRPIDELLARLGAGHGDAPGVPLEAAPAGFGVTLTATLEPLGDGEDDVSFAPGLRGIRPSIVVRDGDGLVHRLAAPRIAVGGGEQRIEVDASVALPEGTVIGPAPPLDVLGVLLEVELPEGALATGSLQLVTLEVETDGGWESIDLGGADAIVATEEEPIGLGAGGPIRLAIAIGDQAPVERPIPALASERLLSLTGIAVGDTVELGQLITRRSYEIVGTVSAFPTVDPAQPFLVVDIGELALADERAGRDLAAGEWWLSVDPDRADAVVSELARDPFSAVSVTSRDELQRELLSDPVALGLIGALVLGALAAVAFATIGFFVSAVVSTRERLGEFALLQAIGLSHRQLSAWLAIENAFLLVIGLVAGTGLGLVLAWVVLPFVALTQEAAIAVPPVQVVIPWPIYGLLYLVALAALAVTVLVIGGLLGRVRVSGVLRSGGE
jgi:hypothetical protein